MLNADPVNPVWGPMCPWGPGYGRLGGGWGPLRRLGTGFVGQGPSREKIVLAVPPAIFGNDLAHRDRVRVAQLSYSDDVGTASFYDLLVFGGIWALREILGPNRQKKPDPKKIEKHVEILFFVAVSKK